LKNGRIRRTLLQRLASRARRLLGGRRAGWWESAGGLVFNARQEVALIRQGGRWTFPKGRRDPGEALDDTACREVHEETGLRARILHYLGMVEGARHETHYYLMALVRDGEDHDDEVDKVSFVSAKKARRLLRSGTDRRLLGEALGALEERKPRR